MLDSMVSFSTRVLQLLGRGLRFAISVILWPFVWAGHWYARRGWVLKVVLGAILLGMIGLYGYFFWVTQRWLNFDPDYVAAYHLPAKSGLTGQQAAPGAGIIGAAEGVSTGTGEGAAQTCRRSVVVDTTADLIDLNVNHNAWISSMILYKLGLFGIDWDSTPF